MTTINERLREAARSGDAVELKSLLCEPNSDALDKDKDGMTALIWAAYGGHEACVELLLPVSDALGKDANGLTALVRASSGGHAACVHLLLPVSDPLATNEFGMTALMAAAWMDQDACVKLLLPACDALQKDTRGWPASEYARRVGHKSLAQFIDAYILSQGDLAAIEMTVCPGTPRGRATPRV